MKWIARGFVFTAALVFGVFVASFFWSQPKGLSYCTFTVKPAPKPQITAESLRGIWKGNWGHNQADCTLLIDRVDGNDFYGTLRKEGAEILFEGTFNPKTRTFYFDETEIVRLGDHMSGWSLGKNGGLISQDGRILVGDGHDQWGQYGWAASNY